MELLGILLGVVVLFFLAAMKLSGNLSRQEERENLWEEQGHL